MTLLRLFCALITGIILVLTNGSPSVAHAAAAPIDLESDVLRGLTLVPAPVSSYNPDYTSDRTPTPEPTQTPAPEPLSASEPVVAPAPQAVGASSAAAASWEVASADIAALARQLVDTYFPQDPHMYTVAYRESVAFSPYYVYGPGTGRVGECGLFQIHPIHARKFTLRGWDFYTDCFDPVRNAEVALEIYRTQGPRAWTTY